MKYLRRYNTVLQILHVLDKFNTMLGRKEQGRRERREEEEPFGAIWCNLVQLVKWEKRKREEMRNYAFVKRVFLSTSSWG